MTLDRWAVEGKVDEVGLWSRSPEEGEAENLFVSGLRGV